MTTALFLPYYDDNPYQDELARGVREAGGEVLVGDHTDLFPVLQALGRHGRPDVLHLHWADKLLVSRWRLLTLLRGIVLLCELLVARLLGVDIVWTVHNRFHHERRVPPKYERPFRHGIVRLASGVIVHGEAAKEAVLDAYRLPERYRERIHVVPHGNYVEVYENDVDRVAARERLDIPQAAPVFLHLGSIRPYKNVPGLVEAFGRLERDDARLLIVGSAPNDEERREHLLSLCDDDDRVETVFEYVPEEELQLYLNAADVGVYPFTDVLTSGSVVLGLSYGLPIVAPRLGCIPETVAPCDELLYDPDDEHGLQDALERSLSADLRSLGDCSRRRAASLDWLAVGRRTLAVYRDRRIAPIETTQLAPSVDAR
jgi:glycosyltransferase involved in cell wall biosynthesis